MSRVQPSNALHGISAIHDVRTRASMNVKVNESGQDDVVSLARCNHASTEYSFDPFVELDASPYPSVWGQDAALHDMPMAHRLPLYRFTRVFFSLAIAQAKQLPHSVRLLVDSLCVSQSCVPV